MKKQLLNKNSHLETTTIKTHHLHFEALFCEFALENTFTLAFNWYILNSTLTSDCQLS